ncbi:glyoxylate/hydroxypyruvate reductase A [Pararhodobacter sp. SW119]|uniref:2-hydroxyacid dehydrogenase n=1 Tax=Pararhodobacter sp. SW119 TaxID=2780075 RepID=UPI001AE0C1C0|nr:glyoxylate/hydroxypyruvate reductase A [Pararhodobacter sp. SW119]
MNTTILFAGGAARWPIWEAPLRRALEESGIHADLTTSAAPETVDFIVYAPSGDIPADFTPFIRCRAVLSLWAGVERIASNTTLTQPLCRMVDPGLTQGMVEYVTGHVLRHHLGLDAILRSQNGRWNPVAPPLATKRPVGILGLGELGAACANTLATIGFPVMGWSRSEKTLQDVDCYHGDEGLSAVLRRAKIVVTLLPATTATENILDARRLALLQQGATIINPGRGSLIDDDALLGALNSGQVGHATLDVFRTEPLPIEHPFWSHPRVTVTPHIAADTRPETASRVIAENVRRGLAGEPLMHLVDREAGY